VKAPRKIEWERCFTKSTIFSSTFFFDPSQVTAMLTTPLHHPKKQHLDDFFVID